MALGPDVAGERQERQIEAVAKIGSVRNVMKVGQLADEYFERMVLGKSQKSRRRQSQQSPSNRPAMSEYQHYEFAAIDRPLTRAEMAELGAVSSRVDITPSRGLAVRRRITMRSWS